MVRWLANGTTSDGQEYGKNDMRYQAQCTRILQHSSWHCTDCFATIAQLKRKISSFCHSDLDRCVSVVSVHFCRCLPLP